jgi:thiol-disulfide isomerase/thioredoxin
MNFRFDCQSLRAAAFSVALLSLLPGGAVFGQPAAVPAPTSIENREKEACTKNLRQIYEAIQAYRREHKDLPNWLSDLVPKYLADPAVFICPVTRRTGRDNPFRHLTDPKMATSYMYEFCDGDAGTIWQGGKMKMRQFKGLQMALAGGDTPILRCHLHNPVLNIGFDGKFYESGEMWEDRFLDVVNMEDFSPRSLLARFTDSSAQAPARPTVTTAGSSRRPLPAHAALLGKPAPDFKLDLLEGGEFELAAFKDKKIVILDFWATWCGPCRSALPILAQVAEQYKSKDVILRAVDLREQPEKIRTYLKTTDFPLTILLDKDGSIAKLYGVTGIPQTVIVGKDGIVQAVHVGYSPEVKQTLQQNLDTLLAGGSLFTGDPEYIK